MLVGAGIVLGSVVSLWAANLVSTLLYGLQPRDPLTLAAAAAVLAAIGAFAGWLPARRASRIDPARVLREG
jgi:ABC-type antimicrobial peptide transport system permease subunit